MLPSLHENFQQYLLLLTRPGNMAEKTAAHLAIIGQFYAADIVQVENNALPLSGRETLRQLELENLARVNALDIGVYDWVADDISGIVWGRMRMQWETLSGHTKKMEQAFMQRWQNDQIVFQQFFYPDNLQN